MIKSTSEFLSTVEQLNKMHKAVASLIDDVLPKNRDQFAMMAEIPIEKIRRLQSELIDYLDGKHKPTVDSLKWASLWNMNN